jgi:hypothetical protein
MPAFLVSVKPRVCPLRHQFSSHKPTVEHWNELCQNNQDDDHKRPPKTMMPIAKPPFYVMEAWPIVNNTQGGPKTTSSSGYSTR